MFKYQDLSFFPCQSSGSPFISGFTGDTQIVIITREMDRAYLIKRAKVSAYSDKRRCWLPYLLLGLSIITQKRRVMLKISC